MSASNVFRKPAGPTDQRIKGDGEPNDVVASEPPGGGGSQALTISNVSGPKEDDYCGACDWVIRWGLAQPSKLGGYAVQHVVINYDVKDGANNSVIGRDNMPRKSRYEFWEAWRINPKQNVTERAQDGLDDDDFFEFRKDGTQGSMVVTGEARFYEGLKTLPAGFKINNTDTQAGDLPSSTTDPKLTGGTPEVAHNLTTVWNCTKASNSHTIIVSHLP